MKFKICDQVKINNENILHVLNRAAAPYRQISKDEIGTVIQVDEEYKQYKICFKNRTVFLGEHNLELAKFVPKIKRGHRLTKMFSDGVAKINVAARIDPEISAKPEKPTRNRKAEREERIKKFRERAAVAKKSISGKILVNPADSRIWVDDWKDAERKISEKLLDIPKVDDKIDVAPNAEILRTEIGILKTELLKIDNYLQNLHIEAETI